MRYDWPSAELDPVRRLRIMASVTHAVFADAVTAHSPAQVWSVLSDLEGELPQLIPDIRVARVHDESGGELGERRVELLALGYLGQRAHFDIVLEPGWCWMQSRFLLCGFAITEEEDQTRYAFLGGFRTGALHGDGVLREARVLRGAGTLREAGVLRRPGRAYARWVTRRIRQRVELRVRS